MNNKIIIFTIILAIFLSCGAVSATDNHVNETMKINEEISLEESTNELTNNTNAKTFNELNEEIISKTEVNLHSNYTYSKQSDEDYKDGIIIDKTVTINGNGFTINSTDMSKLFNVKSNGNLTLNDLILISDYGDTKRSEASFKNMGHVTLNNVTFTTTQTRINESTLSASIYNMATLTITNSKFVNSKIITDRQNYYGLIDNQGSLKIENTVFDNNSLIERCTKDETYATNLIYNSGTLTMTQVNVTNNMMKTLKNIYGLIRAVNSNSIISMDRCHFENNNVQSDSNNVVGVVVYASRNTGTLTITNSKFIKTTGARGAGVIYSLIKNTLINNTFEKNTASDNGGAIYSQQTSIYINNTFKDNSATKGGAIYTTENLQPNNDFPFTGNTFINNKARQGGAIYSEGSIGTTSLPIENNVFISNEASEMGGAIFLRGSWQSKSIIAKKTVFQDNFAKDGSAIYNYMVTGPYITNVSYSIFDNNFGKVINTGAGSSAEYNWWGTNTPDFTKLIKTFTPTNIVQITIEGNETLQNRSEYSVNFKDNVTGEVIELMPDFTVDLKSKLNAVPKSVNIHEGHATFIYIASKIGNETIKVMKNDEEITRISIIVNSTGKTPIFTITANDINYTEKLDLTFTVIEGPKGNGIYKWTIVDSDKHEIESGYVTENNEILYEKEYNIGKYTISVELSNFEGWQDLKMSDSFEIKEIKNETSTTNNDTPANNATAEPANATDPINNQSNETSITNTTNTTTENSTDTNTTNATTPINNQTNENNSTNTNTNPTNDEEIIEIYVDGSVEESGDGSKDNPFKKIKEAINFANDQGHPAIIHVRSGTYNEKEMTITTNMIIKSYDGDVILDGNNRGWFLYSNNPENNLTIIGLTFKNGIRYDTEDSSDGGVVKTEGHLDVINCTFESNFGGTGGGINSHNGANIINSTFKNNKAEYNGAGAYVLDGQTNIINCTFDNNYVKRQGGAIRIQGSTYIENSTFTNNRASLTEGDGYTGHAGNGGAIRVTDGDLNIESSTFINNSAHFAGGAISAGDNSQYSTTHYQLNINNSTFEGNKATFGAGIEANDGINLTNSTLSNNTIPHTVSAKHGQGSGVYVLSGDSILSGNTIKNNTNPDNWQCAEIYSYNGNVAQENNDWGSDNNKITTNNGKITDTINTLPAVNKPTITYNTGERGENTGQTPTNGNGPQQDNGNQNPTGQTDSQNTNQNQNPAGSSDSQNTNGNQNPTGQTDSQNTNGNQNPTGQTESQNTDGNQTSAEPQNTDENQQYNATSSQDATDSESDNPISDMTKQILDTTNMETDTSSENPQQNNIESLNSDNMIETNSTEKLNDNNPKSGVASDIGENSNAAVKVGQEPISDASSPSQAHEISVIKSITSNGNVIPYVALVIVMFLAFIIGYRRKQNEY